MKASRRDMLAGGMAGLAAAGAVRAGAAPVERGGAMLAPRPPMGWNSWNSFATTITESQARETAQIMAEKLLPFGYDVFTVDIQWYEPEASSYTYNTRPRPAMDAHGRMIPAPNRFPSSAGGKGFTQFAREVHALGLQFGIHVMRGIPRAAVEANLPILGTSYRAADVADKRSVCSWNPDMYGVDMTRPGAQAYYDSIFRLYAEWGIDFVKMDDMSRPYDAHAPEIEAAHKAIVATGRPITLSLSPGETPVIRAIMSANMRRCGGFPMTSGTTGGCWRRSLPAGKLDALARAGQLAGCGHAAAGAAGAGRAGYALYPG